MTDRIKELQKESQALEPLAPIRNKVRESVVNYTENFLDTLKHQKAFTMEESKGEDIYSFAPSEESLKMDTLIDVLKKNVDYPSLNPASAGHLGYIPGGGLYYSALGDYIADITNRYAGVFFASPGAVRMENMLLRWMAELMGYPLESGGNLTSGGSIGNLTAIVTARDSFNLKGRDLVKSVIYFTKQVHHSIDKAIRIAGLGECIIRYVPVDLKFRMNAKKLEQAIKEDKLKGLSPWLIIGSVGTTDTGAVDPALEISAIAKKYHLWFHLDGAYGAFFNLCDEGKKALKGVAESDSIVMDPHKSLFLPYGSGAVLIKNRDQMAKSHQYSANYMQDTISSMNEFSPADLSPELSKHFRGLRLWLPLKLIGLKPFRSALEEKILLARYFYEKIGEIKGFELGNYPDLSIVTYRYIPKKGDVNEFNKKLVEEIQKDGRVFISSTILNGNFMLRLAVLSFRTHLDTIDLALELLKEKAQMIEKEL
ncbi:MAG: amino acid decarboxylase [Bacteroidetes bacterium]|nr:amino acid decarboxylase [Bacteroidota bacterium]HET6245678.1 pyridoxal-dependent decarboxylase [Bacteroidia bacterium]